MMRTTALAVLCWAAAACGDNSNPNTPPDLVVPQITMTMPEDTAVQIDATAIDPEGGTLSYLASQPQHGAVTGSGPVFNYTPDANFVGQDDFTITISDGVSLIHVPVTLVVTAVDDAPVAADAQLDIDENNSLELTVAATDVDSPSLIYALVTQPAHGTLDGALPELTYTPDPDYVGDDSFSFVASDGELNSNVATVTISVLATHCGNGLIQLGGNLPCE